MSALRDPKTLSDWIELDYFRRPRRLRWFSNPVTVAVLIGSVGLVVGLFLLNYRQAYQAGPVSSAHTMFNNDCSACHTETFQPAGRLLPGHEVRSVGDNACRHCHDGPKHHDQETFSPSCASCHREHQGRARLAWVDDSHCSACHADLKRKDGKASEFRNVTRFHTDHPEFRLIENVKSGQAKDPGAIRFNHQVHLRAGGVTNPTTGRTSTLECSTCHQPDAQGAYIRPVNYNRHCAECHPLSVDISVALKEPKSQAAADMFARVPAPHEPADRVRGVLRERYLQFFDQHSTEPGSGPTSRPIPGKKFTDRSPRERHPWAEAQLADAEGQLFDFSCKLCHSTAKRDAKTKLLEVPPAQQLERWFTYSRFRHDTHRMLNCAECHSAAKSSKTSDVLMPGIDTCKSCHTPAVGARSDCFECHTYHDHRRGRGLDGPMTIDAILRRRE